MPHTSPGIRSPIFGFQFLIILFDTFRTLLRRNDDGIKCPFEIWITHFTMFFSGDLSIGCLNWSYYPGIGSILLMFRKALDVMSFLTLTVFSPFSHITYYKLLKNNVSYFKKFEFLWTNYCTGSLKTQNISWYYAGN